MKPELKKQIKEDEFVSGVGKAVTWASAHRDTVRLGIGAALVVGAALGAVLYFQGARTAEAEQAMGDAMQIFEAKVTGETPPDQPADAPKPGPTFPTSEKKYEAAAAAFDGVDRRFGSTAFGARARYYGALSRIELGKLAEAEKALVPLAAGAPGLQTTVAQLALANVRRRQGALDQAIDTYRKLASDVTLPFPRDYALLSLGETLEEAKRAGEAAEAYRQLADDFPSSVYAGEARRRAEQLQSDARG